MDTATTGAIFSLTSCLISPIKRKPLSLSSLHSKFFRLHLRHATTSFRRSPFSSLAISARYGGSRSGPRSPRGSRQPQKNDSDDDSALDISSIKSDVVRLIDEDQNMVGIVPKREAIQMAEDAGSDLVILSPEADPPVVKMMNYSKFKYEQRKKKKEQQKKSTASRMDLKELKMGYSIDQHDYDVRLRAARKFLQDGDKVKVMVSMKGRENDFRNKAIELIRRFQTDVGELATEESKSFREKNLCIVMVPNKTLLPKADEPKTKGEPATNGVFGVLLAAQKPPETTSESGSNEVLGGV